MEPSSLPAVNAENGTRTRYIPPSRRRDKPQVVCNSCRRRKLKCDRGRPCENCTRRGLGNSCIYHPITSSEPIKKGEQYAGVQDRIVQLESLVTTLMKSRDGASKDPQMRDDALQTMSTASLHANKPTIATTDASALSESFGHIQLNHNETSYVESNHWRAILEEISELKDYFEDVNECAGVYGKRNTPPDPEVADSLFGQHETATRDEILATVPPRQSLDRLLATYFSQANMAPVVMHCPTFLKQYDNFCVNPDGASIMWVGQLFAMMCLALAYQQYSGSNTNPELRPMIPVYRTRCIQCLVLGNYVKCGPDTMEAMILYMQVEYLRSQDTQAEVWVVLGVIIRLALRMGYHRDPSHSPEISAFAGEMRRRRWAVIIQFDIISSAQFGLPRMIKEAQTDTQEPRNLNDQDIWEEMEELPEARPMDELTVIGFWNEKNKLVSIFGHVSELMASVRPFPYSEVMGLDTRLTEAYRSIPEAYLPKPMSQAILDPPELILGRAFLQVTYHKTRCVLHRKYMFAGKANPAFAYSRITAIEAALNVLNAQSDLGAEAAPGGRLYDQRWKLGQIIKQEFLLATTLLCLYLNQESMVQTPGIDSEKEADVALRERVIKKLSSTYLIWLPLSETSEEAKRAVAALRLVLGKAQRQGFRGSQVVALAMERSWTNNDAVSGNKNLPYMFASPGSVGSDNTPPSLITGSSPTAMELASLPLVPSTEMLDQAQDADLFDIETWDLGEINVDMGGFLDLGYVTQPAA